MVLRMIVIIRLVDLFSHSLRVNHSLFCCRLPEPLKAPHGTLKSTLFTESDQENASESINPCVSLPFIY